MAHALTTQPAAPRDVRSREAAGGRGEWLRIWLACLAFYYPLFWISNSLMWAVPQLLRVAFAGFRLEGFRLTSFGAFASTVAPAAHGGAGFHGPARTMASLGVAVALLLIVTLALIIFGRRFRTLGGLGIALVANAALTQWLGRRFEFGEISPGMIPGVVLFFAVLCFGLWWMLTGWPGTAGWPTESFPGRLGNLLAGFVLLPLVPWQWLGLGWGFARWPYVLLLAAPGLVAAVLVSLRPVSRPAARSQGAGWKTVGLGVLALALLIVGVRKGQSAIERARREANDVAMAAYPILPADTPYPKIFFQKGVSVSAEGWGGYESESARRTLERLRQLGVDSVALVPYGFAERDHPEVRLNTGTGSWESDLGLEQMSRVAHALGMKVMLKPGIWVGGGGYAGQLDFPSPADRAKWFEEYGRFNEHYAQLATKIHADLFCVGGEFEKLTPDEAAWRKLIARARGLYPGPLVYAANFGTEFESIRFWDALDYIGLQDYYPLPDDLSTDEVVRKVEAVQQKYQRPVIFTEAGFPSREGANRNPWEDGRGSKLALDLQARCYQAVFKAFYDKPWFEGVYWWKVGTDGFGGPEDTSLTPWGKPAMDVVKQWYARPER